MFFQPKHTFTVNVETVKSRTMVWTEVSHEFMQQNLQAYHPSSNSTLQIQWVVNKKVEKNKLTQFYIFILGEKLD